MTEAQKTKEAAIKLLRTRLEGKREALEDIDQRLWLYFDDLATHVSADEQDENDVHNVYEVLCGAKFLRMFETYQFNKKKVQTIIRLREGDWVQSGNVWVHVGGGLKCPGTTKAQVYRWQPFQVFVLASVFGFMSWVNTENEAGTKAELLPTERERDGRIWDYRRLCTEFVYFGPRKTDKTGLAAYIQFIFFFFEDVNGETYCCANSSDQAKLLFSRTRQLIAQMDDGNRIRSTQTVIDWKPPYQGIHNSSVRPLSAGGKTKDGMFAQLCCADEFGSAPYTNGKSDMLSLVNVIQSSMGPRREPMTFITTTAGTIQSGPFMEKLDAIHRTLLLELTFSDGTQEHTPDFENDRRLALCLEPDEWETEDEVILSKKSLRKKVNPMLGLIVQHASYDGWISEARTDQSKMPELKAKYFNHYVTGKTEEWIKPDTIRANQERLLQEIAHGEKHASRVDHCTADKGWVVFTGMDFSMGDDLYAHGYLCVNTETGDLLADLDAWITQETLEKISIRPLYEQWIKDGWLHLCEGGVIDTEIPVKRIMELTGWDVKEHAFTRIGCNIMRIGFDPYRSPDPVNMLKAWVHDVLGLKSEVYVVPVSQTLATYNQPVEQLTAIIKHPNGLLRFSPNPLWPYCFGCAVLDKDTRMENKKPVKRNPGSDACKVDPIQALLSAWICWNHVESSERPSE